MRSLTLAVAKKRIRGLSQMTSDKLEVSGRVADKKLPIMLTFTKLSSGKEINISQVKFIRRKILIAVVNIVNRYDDR